MQRCQCHKELSRASLPSLRLSRARNKTKEAFEPSRTCLSCLCSPRLCDRAAPSREGTAAAAKAALQELLDIHPPVLGRLGTVTGPGPPQALLWKWDRGAGRSWLELVRREVLPDPFPAQGLFTSRAITSWRFHLMGFSFRTLLDGTQACGFKVK